MREAIRTDCRPGCLHGVRGSLSLEAALFLPFVVLAVASLLFLIRIAGEEERLLRYYADEAAETAIAAYNGAESTEEARRTEGELHRFRLLFTVGARLADVESKVQPEWISAYSYLFRDGREEGLIRGTLHARLGLPLPAGFQRVAELGETLLFRGFIGAGARSEPLGFDALAASAEGGSVYVFPRAGERYHSPSCRIIEVDARETLLSDAVRQANAPCRSCEPLGLANGSLVYVFPGYGKAYHRGSCTMVERYVVPVNRSEAERQGHSPCYYCGGGL